MQTAQYSGTDALIQSVITAAQALKPSQAIFLPSECIIARSSTGKLRFATGQFEPTWRKGDGETMLREHCEAFLDWRTQGYHASRFANELRAPRTLEPVNVENVGRRDFAIVYEPSERAWDAFHTLTCDYGEWEGRPYGAMDVWCSDGRHLLITGTGEIREAA